MRLGDLHKPVRRVAAIAALAGIMLYSMLVPGHIVSQAMLATGGGEPICHEDTADAGHPGRSPASEDPKPDKKCPFCKGYATFLTAFSGGAGGGILDAPRAAPLAASLDCGIAYVIALTPQSRGPPIEL
jgi:hypothetical protein